MIVSILWKEYREQRAVWLVMAALVAGLLVGVPIVFAAEFELDPALRGPLAVVGVVSTWAYGMVCGAMLLAGEREEKTQGFLDTLPGGRGRLWVAKCIAGLALVAAFVLIVASLVAATFLVDSSEWPGGALVLVTAGVIGLGWGLYTAAWTRTVLGGVGLAVALQFGCYLVTGAIGMSLLTLAGRHVVEGPVEPLPLVLFIVSCLLFPLPVSAFLYGRVDRRRRGRAPSGEFRRRFGATLWLAGRQIRGLAVWLLPLGFALGMFCIPQPLVVWPAVTLALGTICGVSCFLDEQAGPRRFLGDQRYPLGTIWGVKVGLRLALLAAALVVALLPLLVRLTIDSETEIQQQNSEVPFAGNLFRSRIVSMAVSPGVLLFGPALTGFAVGLLSGVVFRKAFIAGVAGVTLALTAFGVWVPGLLGGGLPGWQVFLIPLILLVAARLAMRSWAGERLLSRRVILSMTGLVVCCVLWLGLGLWYRIASIPDTPEPPELGELVAQLRESEKVDTGRLVRSALISLGTRIREWRKEEPAGRGDPIGAPAGAAVRSYYTQLDDVSGRGWAAPGVDRRELGEWLDRIFDDDVWERLDPLPELPVGVVIDPRRVQYTSPLPELDGVIRVGQFLAARGLQMQQKGDPEVFVKHFEIALALARNVKNSGPQAVNLGHWLERTMSHALESWLAALVGRPDLLRRIGDALDRQGSWESTRSVADLSDYLMARNTLDDPAGWLRWLDLGRQETAKALLSEEYLVALVWQLPWEHERQARLLRRHFFANLPVESDSPMIPAVPRHEEHRTRQERAWRTTMGIARLRVALRLHQATTGKPATDLAQLVPKSIAAIPLDPYDDRPFRYRLSAGEKIEGMPVLNEDGTPIATTREIPAGQGILWSVGPNGRDDGGKDFDRPSGGSLIFLVPVEKKK